MVSQASIGSKGGRVIAPLRRRAHESEAMSPRFQADVELLPVLAIRCGANVVSASGRRAHAGKAITRCTKPPGASRVARNSGSLKWCTETYNPPPCRLPTTALPSSRAPAQASAAPPSSPCWPTAGAWFSAAGAKRRCPATPSRARARGAHRHHRSALREGPFRRRSRLHPPAPVRARPALRAAYAEGRGVPAPCQGEPAGGRQRGAGGRRAAAAHRHAAYGGALAGAAHRAGVPRRAAARRAAAVDRASTASSAQLRQRELDAVVGRRACAPATPTAAIASPSRTAPPGTQRRVEAHGPFGNSITTVEPSRKRPISSPCFSDDLAGRRRSIRAPRSARGGLTTPCHTVAMLPTMVAPTSTSTNGPCAAVEHAHHALVAREQPRHAARRGRIDREQRARHVDHARAAGRRTACGCGGSPSGSGTAWRSCRARTARPARRRRRPARWSCSGGPWPAGSGRASMAPNWLIAPSTGQTRSASRERPRAGLAARA